MGKRLLFDLETDGLMQDVTKIHVGVALDLDTMAVRRFENDTLGDLVPFHEQADMLAGHNIINYDIPVLKKICGHDVHEDTKLFDTLVVARLLYGDIKEQDFVAWRAGRLPGELIGRHSLKAWGYRLGIHKGDYGESGPDCWTHWTQEMSDYCEQDVLVCHQLYLKLEAEKGRTSQRAIDLEQSVAKIITRQINHGFMFDIDKAWALYAKLQQLKHKLREELKDKFPQFWIAAGKVKIPQHDHGPPKTKGAKTFREWVGEDGQMLKARLVEGAAYTPVTFAEFNPGSRHHIAHCLKLKYGWDPVKFTEKGEPALDDEVIASLPYPEAKALSEYMKVAKVLGMLADGTKNSAWCKAYNSTTKRIHGNVNPCGAITRRMTHSGPNVAQVPSVAVDGEGHAIWGMDGGYGADCRSLWVVPEGKKLVGVDASGLELRCLAHYMARWDQGAYTDCILSGDIHTMNQHAAGLPSRATAKTFIYALLYGAGLVLLGAIALGGVADHPEAKLRAQGMKLKNNFMRSIPAFAKLSKAVSEKAATCGYIVSLDGSQVPIRHAHAALNTLLQNAGAVIMKVALVEYDRLLKQELPATCSWEFVANIHDEIQVEVDEEYAERVAALGKEAIRNAGEILELRCPLAGDAKIGNNWMETH